MEWDEQTSSDTSLTEPKRCQVKQQSFVVDNRDLTVLQHKSHLTTQNQCILQTPYIEIVTSARVRLVQRRRHRKHIINRFGVVESENLIKSNEKKNAFKKGFKGMQKPRCTSPHISGKAFVGVYVIKIL
jgi:hypothetical protein